MDINKQLAVATTCAAFLLSGCFPTVWRDSPDIEGVVYQKGKPVDGLTVFLDVESNYGDCEKPVASTQTDAQGRFSFNAQESLGVAIFLPMDYVGSWKICFSDGSQYIRGYTGMDLSRSFSEKVFLVCKLDSIDASDKKDVPVEACK